jgi:hypothetical protein
LDAANVTAGANLKKEKEGKRKRKRKRERERWKERKRKAKQLKEGRRRKFIFSPYFPAASQPSSASIFPLSLSFSFGFLLQFSFSN